ncbi:hypothetical protein GLOTRDRAFT_72537 [Gloeophyllum trabeum ATCC 11539]|uniref:Uncharacterized protein n=1 Tax=Gloeophyllum trabeum (strain ATCC 11539 / FP-39264 / Madison 617) TaxID=670483 RepID=S7QFR8_GLOTA|nr:uncharacterized protein GLOTRDRAFT_72537 [Gloeophyllum trabeum ATCC 11539]EPQ58277.1 hypothetical protein GLOTRDRAFT_72537 [Gloeophyllum trabeum ATCC 11539]
MQSSARRLSAPLARCSRRHIHCSASARDLVGPPDPVSNLRPVYYDDPLPAPEAKPRPRLRHPYSLREFSDPDVSTAEPSIHDLELQYKLLRQQTDAFNHAFWTDSNLRFESAKATILQSLPSSSTPTDRDTALTHFYQQWLNQESARQEEYTAEWRRRNWDGIVLAARLEYAKLKAKFSGAGADSDA